MSTLFNYTTINLFNKYIQTIQYFNPHDQNRNSQQRCTKYQSCCRSLSDSSGDRQLITSDCSWLSSHYHALSSQSRLQLQCVCVNSSEAWPNESAQNQTSDELQPMTRNQRMLRQKSADTKQSDWQTQVTKQLK